MSRTMQLRVLNTLQRDHRNPLTLAHILKLKVASGESERLPVVADRDDIQSNVF